MGISNDPVHKGCRESNFQHMKFTSYRKDSSKCPTAIRTPGNPSKLVWSEERKKTVTPDDELETSANNNDPATQRRDLECLSPRELNEAKKGRARRTRRLSCVIYEIN